MDFTERMKRRQQAEAAALDAGKAATAPKTSIRDLTQNQPPTVLDRFGNPIVLGGLYTLAQPHAPVFCVVEMTRVLDPRVKSGTYDIVLESRMQVRVPSGNPITDLHYTGRTQQVVSEPQDLTNEPEPSPAPEPPPPPESTSATVNDDDINHF